MQVSCKVSYSILIKLELQGTQLEPFFESYQSPVEYLKDPSGWLDLSEMESFLTELSQFLSIKDPANFYREVGQKNFELRAWGVLDSVLKMVESPKDIYGQPDRFLSYFLSPLPEIAVHSPTENQVSFKFETLPAAPYTLSYLLGAIEGLPLYTGRNPARVDQVDGDFQISWFDNQESLFDEQEQKRRQFHPEIVQSVMQSFQDTQEKEDPVTSEAFEKMVSLEVERRMAAWLKGQKSFDQSFFKIKNDFYKMYDYFSRAQQIITLISPTARKASVKEAMRRVDWDHVQKEFPGMVESACDSILAMKDAFSLDDTTQPEPEDKPKPTAESVSESFQMLQGGPHV